MRLDNRLMERWRRKFTKLLNCQLTKWPMVFLLLLPPVALAQQSDENNRSPERPGFCDKASTQQEMNQCTAEQLKQVRERLSALFKEISADLAQKKDANGVSKLNAAQQAWLKYRELHCAAARDQSAGPNMAPMIWADCMTSLTLSRIQELRFAYPVKGAPRD